MKTTFKSGDKVKCVHTYPPSKLFNKIYTVDHIRESYGESFVYVEGIDSSFNGFLPHRFELVEPVKKTPEKTTEVVIVEGNVTVTVRKDDIVVNGIVLDQAMIINIADAINYLEGQ
jgi:hypothetical protein